MATDEPVEVEDEGARLCFACAHEPHGAGDCSGELFEAACECEADDRAPLEKLWDTYDGISLSGFLDDVLAQRALIEGRHP